jgi:ubiquinone/menaquinone biosynthesis C-methylase UbiE
MNSVRLQRVRKAERDYHEKCFENYRLYQRGSWLHKPIQLVIDLMDSLDRHKPLQVLDLGCGVGRNSIPLARMVQSSGGRVRCVDLLDKALVKLRITARNIK